MTLEQAIKKAVMSYYLQEYLQDARYQIYLERKEQFRGSLRKIFPVKPPITRIGNYVTWQRMNSAGLVNSGLLMFDSNSSQYCGRELKSVFVPKTTVINNILDVDYVDAAQTVIEEISDYISDSSSKHFSST